MGQPMPGQLAGTVRPAEEMVDEIPPAKRQRVARLPDGQYYSEGDWVNMHPVGKYLNCDRFTEPRPHSTLYH